MSFYGKRDQTKVDEGNQQRSQSSGQRLNLLCMYLLHRNNIENVYKTKTKLNVKYKRQGNECQIQICVRHKCFVKTVL